ncbi:MAG: orotidine-5'-phosphate decarboxylase [Oscillospiraceae bacterium]|jgi:orotidine-5'-phosphate decarboxylase|nr:orotidine-5'-phosphate decarboxylase [Oscillospiraceae bacterium]
MQNNAHAMDRLFEAVEEKGPVCLGLDTDISYIPENFAARFSTISEKLLSFNKAIIDATLDIAAAYKPQIAYYEACGLEGLRAFAQTLEYIRKKGAIAVSDVKRGDIAKTAGMYARAHFTGDFETDIITVNPYMGMDTLEPFFPYLRKGKGLFALIATSNKGAPDIEGIKTESGEKVYQLAGRMIQRAGSAFIGERGYSAIGGVVGCTDVQETKFIRQALPGVFFLIPGYGAQGGAAEDIGAYFSGGNGGIVNSSRGILLARKKPEFSGLNFDEAARAETLRMREELRCHIK